MMDIVSESGMAIGTIYRYFNSKDEIVSAVCEQSLHLSPEALSVHAIQDLLNHLRTEAIEGGEGRLVVQIYAEAAISLPVAGILGSQLARFRRTVADLARVECKGGDAEQIAEAFIAICHGYLSQLAIRGDLDPAPFANALIAIVAPPI